MSTYFHVSLHKILQIKFKHGIETYHVFSITHSNIIIATIHKYKWIQDNTECIVAIHTLHISQSTIVTRAKYVSWFSPTWPVPRDLSYDLLFCLIFTFRLTSGLLLAATCRPFHFIEHTPVHRASSHLQFTPAVHIVQKRLSLYQGKYDSVIIFYFTWSQMSYHAQC